LRTSEEATLWQIIYGYSRSVCCWPDVGKATQQQLGEPAKVNFTTISRIENGEAKQVYIDTVKPLARALERMSPAPTRTGGGVGLD
jgi:DNA-binding XRE family transcriptional regulator